MLTAQKSVFARPAARWLTVLVWIWLAWMAISLYRPLLLDAPQPDVDQSVFIYGGQTIARGGVPYRDFWDHKGPFTYLINALPFIFGSQSLSAITWWELGVSLIALGLLFAVLHRNLGLLAAIGGLASAMLVLEWSLLASNSVESWACWPNCILIFLAFTPRFPFWRGVGVGCLLSVTVLLRPNEAIVGVLVVCFWLSEGHSRDRDWRFFGGGLLLGAVSLLSAILFWLWSRSALADFFDQYFFFNSVYSRYGWSLPEFNGSVITSHATFWGVRGDALRNVISHVKVVFYVALVAAISVLWGWRRRVRTMSEKQNSSGLQTNLAAQSLCRFGLFLLPLQLLGALISGRDFRHYYIGLALGVAVLNAALLRDFIEMRPQWSRFQTYWQTAIVVMLVFMATRPQFRRWRYHPDPQMAVSPKLLIFIKQHSTPDEPILAWGSNVRLLLHSNRRSATRFIYQKALIFPHYNVNGFQTRRFFAEWRDNPPRVIIDDTTRHRLLPLRQTPWMRPLLRDYGPPTEIENGVWGWTLKNSRVLPVESP